MTGLGLQAVSAHIRATEELTRKVWSTFLDVEGTGYINSTDLREGLKRLGLPASRKVVQDIFDAADQGRVHAARTAAGPSGAHNRTATAL